MRVLHVYDGIMPFGGGSQAAILLWLVNLRKQGIHAQLLCNKNGLTDYHEFFLQNSALSLNRLYPNFSLSLRLDKALYRIIIASEFDIIHLHEASVLTQKVASLAKQHNIPIISSFHTNLRSMHVKQFPLSLIFNERALVNKLVSRFQLSSFKKSDVVTTPSHAFQKLLTPAVKKNVTYLPYPISSVFFKKYAARTKTPQKIISVSRLSGEKHINKLIEAISLVKDAYTLTIVGEGVDRTYLEKKARKLGIIDKIRFTGWVENDKLPALLSKHDIFISLSSYETFGIASIEALSQGLVCIVADYAVSREVLPAHTAIFTKSTDPKTIARILEQLQKKPDIYDSLQRSIAKNMASIKKYHEVAATKELVRLYKQTLYLKKSDTL